MPGFSLRPDHELGRAGDVSAGPGVGPRGCMQSVADGGRHQLMPGGVEINLIDAVATGVMRAQHRLRGVRQPGVLLGDGGPGQPAELVQFRLGEAAAFAGQRR